MNTAIKIETIEDIGICTLTGSSAPSSYLDESFFAALHTIEKQAKTMPIYILIFNIESPTGQAQPTSFTSLREAINNDSFPETYAGYLRILTSITQLTIPTIACIKGPCTGAALELALLCTYRFAYDDPQTYIQFPEINLGLFPPWASAMWMYQKYGTHFLNVLCKLRTPLPIAQAEEIQMIDVALPPPIYEKQILALAYDIIRHGSITNPASHSFSLAQIGREKATRKLTVGKYDACIPALKKNNRPEFIRQHIAYLIQAFTQTHLNQKIQYIQHVHQFERDYRKNLRYEPREARKLKIGIIGHCENLNPIVFNILKEGHFVRIFEVDNQTTIHLEKQVQWMFAKSKIQNPFYRFRTVRRLEKLAHMDLIFFVKTGTWVRQLDKMEIKRPIIYLKFLVQLRETSPANDGLPTTPFHRMFIYPPQLGFQITQLRLHAEQPGTNFWYSFLPRIKLQPLLLSEQPPAICDVLEAMLFNCAFEFLDWGFTPQEVDEIMCDFGFQNGAFRVLTNRYSPVGLSLCLNNIQQAQPFPVHPLLQNYVDGHFKFQQSKSFFSLLPLGEEKRSPLQEKPIGQDNFTKGAAYEAFYSRRVAAKAHHQSLIIPHILAILITTLNAYLNQEEPERKPLVKTLLDILSVNHLGFPAAKTGILYYAEHHANEISSTIAK